MTKFKSAEVALNLVMDADDRTEGMMAGWDIELARQKMLFFTTPDEFSAVYEGVVRPLNAKFPASGSALKTRAISFMLGIAESLLSPIELHHNLCSDKLFGCSKMSDDDVARYRKASADLVRDWAKQDKNAFLSVTKLIKVEDMAANKGDNLFAAWALKWQDENGRDPYASVDDYLTCFGALYQRGMYYPDLYFAREDGKTKTQFFNDYGMQALRCRRMGSLGGTTNPAIALGGEDDMSGISNIWGKTTTDFICSVPNKWHNVRKLIAAEQVEKSEADDWGATKFTEWVVVDAMLGLRSIFLLRGLGRVAFQLRPDWHNDEKKLTYAGGEIYDILCSRVKIFDDILLDGADEKYKQIAKPRVGVSNNHFKVACTGQACLNVVRSFNSGHSENYPDALKHRMFTNVTLSYEVSQMYAASMATENGIRDYEKRAGEKVDDGEGGSVITSMIGRFNDAIRDYRVKSLIAALPGSSKFKSIEPASVKKLTDASVNNAEFVAEAKAAGIDFDPTSEEDAIDRAGTLCTKRVVMLLEKNEGLKRTRILTASKRNFFQNTELLDVPFSTDFGNIQRMYLNVMPLEVTDWKTLYEDMGENGYPKPGSIWAKRSETLTKIWPDWTKVFEVATVKPEEYEGAIYVQPTLKQFIGMWNENIARAKKFAGKVNK
ncbi:hypothetical protein LLG46_04605 [bacterium]|nr:hypothetical protein [bacterium]